MNVAEIFVSYYPTTPPKNRTLVKSSRTVYDMIHEIWNMDQIDYREEFMVLYLDRKHGIIGHHLHSTGSDVATIVSVKQLIAIALKVNACALILMHNHPSGQLCPSENDRALTKEVKEAAKFFDISLLDHLIVTSDGYYSFADEGIL